MITQSLVRDLFDYDPKTGLLTNRTYRGGRSGRAGSIAGSPHIDGYLSVMVAGKNYMLHRIIWLHTYGYLPEEDVDHRDGNRSNNRLTNLRLASRTENNQNMAIRSDNTTGVFGVSRVGSKWRARVTVAGKHFHAGYHPTKEAATAAYLAAKARHHVFQPVPRHLISNL
jgi:hypothetical protein